MNPGFIIFSTDQQSDIVFAEIIYISLCVTSALGGEPRKMLRIIQRFEKHCNFHLQGEYVLVGIFWKPYTGQAVVGKLYLMVLIGRVEERVATL
jgi:hypothetical protein